MHQIMIDIYTAILPALVLVIGIYLKHIINRGADAIEAGTAARIDAGARDALHSALMTGIAAALSRGLTGQAAIDAGIEHARGAGAGGAIDHFAVGAVALQTLGESKLWEALQPQVPMLELVPGEPLSFGGDH